MTEIVDIVSRAGEAKGLIKDPKEHIQSWWLTKHTFFETRLLEYIYWHFKERVFVDVGSNVGNHTLFFAKFCEPHHIISVEPQADVVEFQRELLRVNDVHRRVTVHQCAVSNYNGRGTMKPWDVNPAYYWCAGQLQEGDDIPVTTIDDILADVKHINILKIDVEMREMKVLEGAVTTLTEKKPALFLEIRDKPAYYLAKDFLLKLGYRRVGSHFQEGQVFEFTVHADETQLSRLA